MRRLACELQLELAALPLQLPHLLAHMDRDPDQAGLVVDRALDRLADPPGRVGRELVAEPPIELLDRSHQPEHTFLQQVEELDAAAAMVSW